MTCRSCGATIDAKAIICYRCGAPTAEPSTPARASGRSFLNARLVLVMLVVIGVVVYFVMHFAGGQ